MRRWRLLGLLNAGGPQRPDGDCGPERLPTMSTRTLHLSGKIDLSGTVTTSVSYVGSRTTARSRRKIPNGTHHLIVRAADNSVLHDQLFALEESELAPHDIDVHHAASAGAGRSRRQPDLAVQLARAVPRQRDESRDRSRQRGAVVEDGQRQCADGERHRAQRRIVQCRASAECDVDGKRPDGDALQFALDYSADNGATWMKINPMIIGNSLLWTPGFVTG